MSDDGGTRSAIKVKVETSAQIWVQRQAIDLTGEWLPVGGAINLEPGANYTIHLGRRAEDPTGGSNVRLIIAER